MLLPFETVQYLIDFLLMEPNKNLISYSEVPTTAPITIIPANEINEPILPHNIHIARTPHTIIIKDDLIASTFFLLSRYDEYRQPEAVDIHHRFVSGRSFLGSHGLLQTPIVDQYTTFIYNLLNRPIPKRQRHTYITHDIDIISHYHRPRGFVGGLYRTIFKKSTTNESIKTIFSSALNINNDPAYTFQHFQSIDNVAYRENNISSSKTTEIIYFIKPHRARNRYDRPAYHYSELPKLPGTIGIHSLYETYENPALLSKPAFAKLPHKYHRSHYLRILPPTQMHHYVNAGISDDFSISYADIPGFRLGTTRPTLAINPATAQLLPLTLHPLSIMDTTLIDSRYLNLSYDQSIDLCHSIIDTINFHQGDVTILFHNNSFAYPTIARLYPQLISYLFPNSTDT